MKLIRLFTFVLVATIVVWCVFWVFVMDQDLNLMARSVLPIPIVGTMVVTSILAGGINLAYRLIKKARTTNFPIILWSCWAIICFGLIAVLFTSNG